MAKNDNNTAEAAFVNPFSTGVTHDEFLKAIPEGKTIREYLTGKTLVDDPASKVTNDDHISWIEAEIESYKNHLKNKDGNLKKAWAEHQILSNPDLTDKEKKDILKNL